MLLQFCFKGNSYKYRWDSIKNKFKDNLDNLSADKYMRMVVSISPMKD